MLVDIHAKTERSPGVTASVHDVLKRAKDEGLDAVLIADELATSHCNQVLTEAQKLGIKAFIGVEIPSDKGLLIGVVPELDAFYEAEEWRQLTQVTTPSAESVIDMFQSRGGAVIASRPYDLNIPYNMGDLIFTLQGLSAVEVFNSRTTPIQNDFALEAASFLGLSTAGGTDNMRGTSSVGKNATFFMQDIQSQQEFVEALRESKFWAVQIGAPAAAPKQDRQERRGRSQDDQPQGKPQGSDRRREGDGGRENRSEGGGRSEGGRGGNGGGRRRRSGGGGGGGNRR